jgi:hypothetical protein
MLLSQAVTDPFSAYTLGLRVHGVVVSTISQTDSHEGDCSMFPIDGLKQLGISFFGRSRAEQQYRSSWQARRRPPTRPCLETLEERSLLDGTPQSQLAADIGKLGFDMTRATIDSAVFTSEIAAISGEGTPEGIAALAALAPVMKFPGMVADAGSLVKDYHEGNFKGMAGDVMSLVGKTVFAIVGDLIALEQDQVAIYHDILSISIPTLFPTPAPTPPAPTPASSVAGTYSATLVPNADSNVRGNQTVTLTLNSDGSGKASVSPFLGAPLTFSFPAGTAQLVEGDNGTAFLDYTSPSGASIFVDAMLNADGSLSCDSLDVSDGHAHLADFDGATLNRQG